MTTPAPNFRALCGDMLFAVQLYTGQNPAASEMSSVEVTEKLMDAMAATAAALATPPPEPPTDEGLQKAEVYNEEFWRKHALEQLLHASISYRLGVYSSEELELYEKRARFYLDRWPQAKPPEPPTNEEIDLFLESIRIPWILDQINRVEPDPAPDFDIVIARAVLERWG